jgi:hypothetical protein
MNKKTLKALKGSIKHWEDNVKRSEKNEVLLLSDKNCPLCHLFIYERCAKCPIYLRTKAEWCHNTPFRKVSSIVRRGEINGNLVVEACKEELKFLKSLLPKTKTAKKI